MRNIPDVLRARGYRLYLADGRRLVDLWLNGGAAILGHTPQNLLRELKNTASRGLYAPFPHFTEGRYLKSLLKLFPGFSFRFYAAPPQELTALFNSGAVKLWRPYENPEKPLSVNDSPFFIPILPGVQTWRDGLPLGLCVVAAKTGSAQEKDLLAQLPQNDALSPILFAVAARGVYDILAAKERANPKLPQVAKTLKNTSSIWQRQGIYLSLKKKTSSQEWETLFNQFLEAGFLLPPTQNYPLILPGELSDGEEAKLLECIC
ncbi:MAG: hypothetical protein FWD22_04250 [Treponema sp.]|nr:hypothetical protein [Treponema sp.]